MSDIDDALFLIEGGYRQVLIEGIDSFTCQLDNDSKGFTDEEIQVLIAFVTRLDFNVPTHISILPAGKKASNVRVFDGLQDIYCNSPWLEKAIASLKEKVIRKD